MTIVARAEVLAEQFVAPLGRRWSHVQAVAARAREVAAAVSQDDVEILVSAAWLHDIGYSDQIGHFGFHPLDGARFLRAHDWPESIVNLVAHHSGARFEAEERGMSSELKAFPFADSPVLDALVLADLTTGPSGERLSYEERISEILQRYPEGDPVHRTWIKAAPILKEAVKRAELRIVAASS